MKKWLWQGKPWQAFKGFAIFFSFAMNLILLIILLLVAPIILPAISGIGQPLVGGLSTSFVQMNDARIVQQITVDDDLDIAFTLPLSTTTDVVLVDDVPLSVPATYVFPNGGGAINGTVQLRLPRGLSLPVALDLTVPVEQTIPVQLDVPVEIPLAETDLGVPFATLEGLFVPLDAFMRGLPADNDDFFERLRQADPEAPRNAERAVP
jgi:hypothetical protein